MANEMQQQQSKAVAPVKQFFESETVKNKFKELLGKRSNQFVASVLQAAMSNNILKDADPVTVYSAAMMAATLDLPINSQLGFAYIVPYRNKGQAQAQFQLGYKGYIQLAQRSGLFKTIAATEVYEGQLISEDPLKGFQFDWKAKKSDTVIGYAAFFELLNGFEKTFYMSKSQMEIHGRRYSKSFDTGVWKSDFNSMGIKTVLKLLLSKYAPLSIEMQKAVVADGGVILDSDGDVPTVDYGTVEAEVVNQEEERIKQFAANCKDVKEARETLGNLDDVESAIYEANLPEEIKSNLFE